MAWDLEGFFLLIDSDFLIFRTKFLLYPIFNQQNSIHFMSYKVMLLAKGQLYN